MWRRYALPSITYVAFSLLSCAVHSENQHRNSDTTAENSVLSKNSEQRFIIKFKGENKLFNSNENTLSPQRAESQLLREAKADTLRSAGAKQTKPLDIINGFSIEADTDTLNTLKKNPNIDFIEPDPVRNFQAEVVPYGIQQIQADFLSDAGTGNMTVCVADSGYELSHDDLPATANITGEVSNSLLQEVDLGAWHHDSYGHGSHMAGTITAIGGNGIGTSGVLPSGNINLHVVKLIHNPNWWPLYGSDMITAVERCVEAGAKVINLSIAGPQNSQAEEQAMQAAYDAGALIIGASGKFGTSAYFYPASYDSVISVSAIDANETPWQFNQTNDQVELVAAGVNVKSTTRNNGYGTWDGTSVATAFTSGGLALLWSHHPECTNQEIRNIAHQTAKDLGETGRDETFGYGTLQLKAASDLISEAGCDGIANEAPEISGTPEISVSVGDEYSFVPVASDADGDELMFVVSNLPTWMQFDVTTGQLLGNASLADVGRYENIVIAVSDGEFSAELPAFSVTVVESQFTEWTDKGEPYDISAWLPVIDGQLADFQQSRDFKQDQHRFEQKRKLDSATGIEVNNGEAIEHVRTQDRTEQRLVSVVVGEWNNIDQPFDCSPWSPAANTIDVGQQFQQTRNCQQQQQRERTYSHNANVLSTEIDEQTITVNQEQTATGSKRDWQVTSSTFTDWENDGTAFGHGEWTPAIASQTSNFTQSQAYKQKQKRFEQKRERDSISGDIRNVGSPIARSQILEKNESRSVSVSWSGWSQDGGRYGYSSWSPSTSNYSCTVNVDQRRTYLQNFKGTYTYSVSGTNLYARIVNKTEQYPESRRVSGDQPNWLGIASEYSAWQTSGGRYDYSAWTPSSSNQTSNFTQSRTYKQDYTRTKYNRQKDTCSGTIRTVSSESQRKTETGTETRTITVPCSGWSPGGPPVYIGNWTPSASQYYCDASVNQTRSFTQNYDRTCYHSNAHSFVDSKTEPGTASRTVNGTKIRYETLPPEYTPWENDGPPYGYSAWTPAATTQTASFPQNRTYKQNQLRYRQERRKNLCNNTVENVGSPVKETRTITKPDPRTVTVSWTAWVKEGGLYNCGAYEPAVWEKPLGLRFTQRAQCSQKYKRTRNYSSGESYSESHVGGGEAKREAIGTKVTTKWVSIGLKTQWLSNMSYNSARNIFNQIQVTSVTIGGACSSAGQVVVVNKFFNVEDGECDYGGYCRSYLIETSEAKCQ